MWYNYLKIAWRQVMRKPKMSFLMTVGLGVGIAASILLIKYISFQWNFDQFHEHKAEIVRIQHDHFHQGATTSRSAKTYAGVPVIARESLPEVEAFVRMGHWIANDVLLRNGENLFRGKSCFFVDSNFFDLFSFRLLEGDQEGVLTEPNTLVLTSRMAKRLFGDQDPIGEELLFENMKTFLVTGIVEDPPVQSHIQFDILISLATMNQWGFGDEGVYGDQHLQHPYVYSYLKVHPTSDLPDLAERLTEEVAARKPDAEGEDVFHLQRMEDVHLYSQLDHEIGQTGHGTNIWIFSGIALLILILGWANHFNLFFGTALDQLPALGIRRVIGARRSHLFRQLFVAASLPAVLGLLIGVLVARFAVPIISDRFQIPLNEVTILSLSIHEPAFQLLFVLLFGTVLSALLPASLLSSINMEAFLKGQSLISPRGSRLRTALVTLQFAIIMALMASSLIIYQQTGFMASKDNGFKMDDVLTIRAPLGKNYEEHRKDFPVFNQAVRSTPGISAMGVSNQIPGNQLELLNELTYGANTYNHSFFRNYGSLSFFDAFDIPFLAKDNAIDPLKSDRNFSIINEMAAEMLGFKTPQSAMHKRLKISDWKEVEIIGVVANHHQRSMHHSVMPIIYDLSKNNLMTDGYYAFELASGADEQTVLESIHAHYREAFPHTVFDPIDVEQHFASQYKSDDHFKMLNMTFTILAFFISFLGLIGLMMITVGKRIKEIGIRKILGANLTNIVTLLLSDFVRILLVSMLLAGFSSYFLMYRWLENFTYRIDISWLVFIFAGIFTGFLVLVVVGVMSHRATSINPAETLRD